VGGEARPLAFRQKEHVEDLYCLSVLRPGVGSVW